MGHGFLWDFERTSVLSQENYDLVWRMRFVLSLGLPENMFKKRFPFADRRGGEGSGPSGERKGGRALLPGWRAGTGHHGSASSSADNPHYNFWPKQPLNPTRQWQRVKWHQQCNRILAGQKQHWFWSQSTHWGNFGIAFKNFVRKHHLLGHKEAWSACFWAKKSGSKQAMVGPGDQSLNNLKSNSFWEDTKCKVGVELIMSMRLINNPWRRRTHRENICLI